MSCAQFLTSPFRLPKPGVVIPVIPDPEHPEYTAYWLRDGCRIYHTWLNGLAVPGPRDDPKLLRTLLDDSVHALVRTQHVVSLAGNVFTGGLEEAVFDINLGKITNPVYRPGSPGAGAESACAIRRRFFKSSFHRWTAFPCGGAHQVC